MRCNRARAALLALAAVAACDDAGPPAPALTDVGALRAKVSACLGVEAAVAFTFFWPERLEGAPGAGACVASARDCAEVLACGGFSAPGCIGGSDRCEDGVAVACVRLGSGPQVERRRDCAANAAGNSVCSIEDDLLNGRGAFCHSSASCAAEHCDGDVVVRCRGGFEVRSDCAAEGKGCIEAGGQASCAFAETCESDRCDGDVIEICEVGRVAMRERCSELVPGTTCSDRMGLVECAPASPSVDCADQSGFESWCDGGLAVACFYGVRTEVDCGALPEGACQARVDHGRSSATCTAAEPFNSSVITRS